MRQGENVLWSPCRKKEAIKVKYLLLWSEEEGIEVSSTCNLSDTESNTLSVYGDRFGKYVAPKSNC